MELCIDTVIGEILDRHPASQAVFESFDMPCMDCPSSRGETLGEACEIHDVDPETLLSALRAHCGG